MNKWLALTIMVLLAGGAAAMQLPPGGQEFQAGVAAAQKQDWDAAIRAFEAALSMNPDLYGSHFYLGYAYEQKQNFAKTGEHFAAFVQRAGDNPEGAEQIAYATRGGGLALARVNDPAAIPLLEKAAAAKPNDKEVLYALAVTLMRNNQAAKADPYFLKVTQLDPSLPLPHYFAGRSAFNTERWEDAKRFLNQYLNLGADDNLGSDAHFMLGSMALRESEGGGDATAQQALAKDHLNKFLELKPDSPQAPQAHYILGSLAAQSEDTETARSHFQAYLKLQPSGAQAEEVKQFLADLAEDEAAAAEEAAANN
jgi:tetratricopeptide (TPR) repeat protein